MTDDGDRLLTPAQVEARMASLRTRAERIAALREWLAVAESLAADPGPADVDAEDWDAGERDEDMRRRAQAAAEELRARLVDLLP
ncbi:MAG TPA: hypothetical protein VNF47_04535 [Streptosporangiaceae bacterium]|nr:hypothetical protein [Streptosporangiaceae bacterium]